MRARRAVVIAVLTPAVALVPGALLSGVSASAASAAPAASHPVAPPAPPGTPLGKARPHHAGGAAAALAHLGYENKICDGCQPPLLYEGGPVMGTAATPGELTVYPIYWAPPGTTFDPSYPALIDGYLKNVAAASGTKSNVYSVGTEYYQTVNGQNQNISYRVHYGQEIDAADAGSPSDTTCQPTDGVSTVCVTDAQMQDELLAILNNDSLAPDLAHIYVVFLPNGVQTQDSGGSYSAVDFCGYHSEFDTTGGPLLYANMPYGQVCDSGQSPNGTAAADDAIDTLDHEVMETITDPLGNGWGDFQGNEIGDECSNIYGAALGSTQATNPAGGSSFNQSIGSGHYYAQEEYSNAAGACVQAEGAAAGPANQVTVSLTPASVPADGTSSSSVEVTVAGPDGSPVAGDTVTFNVSAVKAAAGSCGAVSPTQTTTSAQGTATVTYTATTANVLCNVVATEATGGAAGKAQLTQGNPPPVATFARVAGANRAATAVAASQATYPGNGAAKAVVLASDATFPDALAGGPLAAKAGGPLLLTDPGSLNPVTEAEIKRVLPAGGPVVIVGGSGAVSDAVAQQLGADGFNVIRLAGPNRFATAVTVADAMGDPSTVVEASGLSFPDALAGGPVAAKLGGVVLLTDGATQAAETANYLSAHPGTHVALGGPAAHADPSAQAIVGADRYDTAARVAATFFPSTRVAGLASGLAFPDALAGGASVATVPAPVLLTDPAKLPTQAAVYLNSVSGTLTTIAVFGGTAAVTDTVANQATTAG